MVGLRDQDTDILRFNLCKLPMSYVGLYLYHYAKHSRLSNKYDRCFLIQEIQERIATVSLNMTVTEYAFFGHEYDRYPINCLMSQ